MINQVHAVFTIVDYSKADDIAAIYKKEHIPICLSTHGNGIADSSILELLGFGENKKSIMITLLSTERASYIFDVISEKMDIRKPGKGIIFSIPVTSATTFLASLIENDNINNKSDKKESELHMTAEHENELIITITSKGCFPDVKAAANAAGARGGTLIHGLGLGGEEAQKFLGISIQPEKEIILIVVDRKDKNRIMNAISEAAGINTEGKGIIFSLPVSSALGIHGLSVKESEE